VQDDLDMAVLPRTRTVGGWHERPGLAADRTRSIAIAGSP
jgi:hypothetical protein